MMVLVFAGTSCRNNSGSNKVYSINGGFNAHNEIIDSCEYIVAPYRLSHKGNCKFCKERHRKELIEVVTEIVNKTND